MEGKYRTIRKEVVDSVVVALTNDQYYHHWRGDRMGLLADLQTLADTECLEDYVEGHMAFLKGFVWGSTTCMGFPIEDPFITRR